jgi:hypothetical protein
VTPWLEQIVRGLFLLLCGLLPSAPDSTRPGGGDSGTVILPNSAARACYEPRLAERAMWSVERLGDEDAVCIVLPSMFPEVSVAQLSTCDGSFTEPFPVHDVVISLPTDLLAELAQVDPGYVKLGLFVVDPGTDRVLDLTFVVELEGGMPASAQLVAH